MRIRRAATVSAEFGDNGWNSVGVFGDDRQIGRSSQLSGNAGIDRVGRIHRHDSVGESGFAQVAQQNGSNWRAPSRAVTITIVFGSNKASKFRMLMSFDHLRPGSAAVSRRDPAA